MIRISRGFSAKVADPVPQVFRYLPFSATDMPISEVTDLKSKKGTRQGIFSLFSQNKATPPHPSLIGKFYKNVAILDGKELNEYLARSTEPRMHLRVLNFKEELKQAGYKLEYVGPQPDSYLWNEFYSKRFNLCGLFLERDFNHPHSEYQIKTSKDTITYSHPSEKIKNAKQAAGAISSHLKKVWKENYSQNAEIKKELLAKINQAGNDKINPFEFLLPLDIDVWQVAVEHKIPWQLVKSGDRIDFNLTRTSLFRFEQIVMPYSTNTYLVDIDRVIKRENDGKFYEEIV